MRIRTYLRQRTTKPRHKKKKLADSAFCTAVFLCCAGHPKLLFVVLNYNAGCHYTEPEPPDESCGILLARVLKARWCSRAVEDVSSAVRALGDVWCDALVGVLSRVAFRNTVEGKATKKEQCTIRHTSHRS